MSRRTAALNPLAFRCPSVQDECFVLHPLVIVYPPGLPQLGRAGMDRVGAAGSLTPSTSNPAVLDQVLSGLDHGEVVATIQEQHAPPVMRDEARARPYFR